MDTVADSEVAKVVWSQQPTNDHLIEGNATLKPDEKEIMGFLSHDRLMEASEPIKRPLTRE